MIIEGHSCELRSSVLTLGISWGNLNIQKTGTGIHAIK